MQSFEKNLITTKDAGELSGYTSDYLARLARSGKIAGTRIGHSWFIEKESLTRFLSQQGDRKIDYARALARAREAEYRKHHSFLLNATKALSKPLPVPSLNFSGTFLHSHAFALIVALLVVASGAFLAQAAPASQFGAEALAVMREVASGFNATFGNIPSRIAAHINAAGIKMRAISPRAALTNAITSEHLASPILANPNLSLLRMAITDTQNARIASQLGSSTSKLSSSVAPIIITNDEMLTFAFNAYAFVAHPSRIADSLTHAYVAIGDDIYTALIASLSGYRSLITYSGNGALALAAPARDTLVTTPTKLVWWLAAASRLITKMNLAFGGFIINATHMAIRSDVSLAYGTAAAVPASARAAVAFTGNAGDRLARIAAQTPAFAAASFLRATSVPANIAPRTAQAIFAVEYAGARPFIALTNSVTENYLTFVNGTGKVAYESTMGVRLLPLAFENLYLGALGKSALALDTFVRMPKVAAVLNAPPMRALRSFSEAGIAAIAPTLSAGEQVALATYTTLNNLFSSATKELAFLMTPTPTIVMPTGVPKTHSVAVVPTSTLPLAPSTSYPTYTTVVKGVSEDFMNQSLASLRTNILNTVAGMIQPVSHQGATNVTTIQQVNMIQKLDELIVTNGDFRGGAWTNGVSISATAGSFTNLSVSSTTSTTLTAGETTLATTTITGDLAVSGIITPSIISASDYISAPYFIATSTTATSTFAGSLAIGTTSPWGNGIFTVGTSSPLLYISSNTGNVGIGTANPQYVLDMYKASTQISGDNKGINITLATNPTAVSSENSYGLMTLNDYQANFATNSGIWVMGGYTAARNSGTATLQNVVGLWGKSENLSVGSINDSYGVVGQSRNTGAGTILKSYGVTGASRNNSTGSITEAVGVYGDIINANVAGVISNAYNIKAATPYSNVGTIQNLYGVYIGSQNPTGGGTIVNKWALYQAGATDQSYFAGNVGIGTTTPYSLLSISNSATTAINTPLFTISSTTSGTATSTLMTVLANGNVGIGTTTPGSALSVNGSGYLTGTLTAGDGNASTIYGPLTVTGTSTQSGVFNIQRGLNNTNNTLSFNDQTGASLMRIYTDANTGYGRIVGDQSYLTLGTLLGGTALTIDTLNNVDAVALSISGTGAGLTFSGTGNHDITASAGTLRIGSNTIIGNIQALDNTVDIGTPDVRFDMIYANEVNAITLVGTITGGNVSAETLTINSDNTTTADLENSFLVFTRGSLPSAHLKWNADTSAKRFEFNQPIYIQDTSLTSATSTLFVQGWSGQTGDIFRIASSSSENNSYLNVTAAGLVGIGTTSPYSMLSVAGQIVAQNFMATSTTATSTFAGGFSVGLCVTGDTRLRRRRRKKDLEDMGWKFDEDPKNETEEKETATLADGGSPRMSRSGGWTRFVPDSIANWFSTSSPASGLHTVYHAGNGYITDGVHIYDEAAIKDIKEGDEIQSLNEKTGELVWSKVKQLAFMGVKQTYRLTTASGKTIRTTGNHPYLARKTKNHDLSAGAALVRSIVLIDYANIKAWARSLGYSVDLKALHKGLMSAGVSSFRFYYGTDGKNKNAASFFHKIASFGYIVVTKAVQYFSMSFYDLLEQPFNTRWLCALPKSIQETLMREAKRLDAEGIRLLQPKANFDVEITTDAIRLAGEFDHVVLFSGDGDFVSLLVQLRVLGKKTTVVSGKKYLSGELKESAHSWKYLEHLNDAIGFLKLPPEPYKKPQPALRRVWGESKSSVADLLGLSSAPQTPVDNLVHAACGELVESGEGSWRKVSELKEGMEIAVAAPSEIAASPISQGAAWDRIISVEPVAEEDVYDIEIEGTHNFIGNDIVAHNTAFTVNQGAPAGSLSVNPSGLVGIGTTSPATTLSVQGNGYFSGTGFFGGTITGTSTLAIQSTTATSTFSTGGLTVGTSQFVVQQTSGNVGIGTTSPAGKMDISGSDTSTSLTTFSGTRSLSIVNTNTTANNATGLVFRTMDANGVLTTGAKMMGVYTSHTASAVSGELAFLTNNAGTVGERMRIDKSGNVGIGTTSPQWLLNPTSATASQLALSAGAGVAQWAFRNAGGNLYVAPTTVAGTATSTTALTILNSGNVGIGTTSPWGKLSIAGSSVYSGNPLFAVSSSTPTATTTVFVINSQGNVGIGTTTPVSLLSISGDSGLSHYSANYVSVGSGLRIAFKASTGGVDRWSLGTIGAGDMAINMAGSEKVRIKSDGNVGIGTTSPATKLEVGGTTANVTLDGYLNCAAGITSDTNGKLICNTSDQRLKQNIVSLVATSSLAAINALNPASFNWRDSSMSTSQQFGLVAQQVQNVFPNLVQMTNPTALTPDGTLTVNYFGLISPMISAIQELDTKLRQLGPLAAVLSIEPGVESQCVTGDTRLRRRRKVRVAAGPSADFDFVFDEIAICDVAVGDEIQSLDERTGRVVYSRVNGLIDMGMQEVFELRTASGRTIRTTSNHPFFARLAQKTV